MARPRSFDEGEALQQAMALFWTQGYEKTSMDDLVRVTGVHRGTLYSLYKDKRGILIAALDRYIEDVIRPMTQTLRSEPDGWQALQRFFEHYVQKTSAAAAPRSCLTVHLAMEAGNADPDIAARLQTTARLLEDSFEAALRRAQLNGDVPKDKDARLLASLLRCSLHGLQVFARATPRHEDFKAIPSMLLSMIKA
ncbi:MAG: TetR/AcrR family transcriptional regulator [Aquabacterium sp.]|nr:MAG: TetR/AcrR family transcriptional regulator [Aquabacterium sp.]